MPRLPPCERPYSKSRIKILEIGCHPIKLYTVSLDTIIQLAKNYPVILSLAHISPSYRRKFHDTHVKWVIKIKYTVIYRIALICQCGNYIKIGSLLLLVFSCQRGLLHGDLYCHPTPLQ